MQKTKKKSDECLLSSLTHFYCLELLSRWLSTLIVVIQICIGYNIFSLYSRYTPECILRTHQIQRTVSLVHFPIQTQDHEKHI